MHRIDRLISQKQSLTLDDQKKIDEYILWLSDQTLPQGDFRANSEMDTQQRIRVAAPQHGCMLWRNNSGVLKNTEGQPVRYGLGNDSPKVNRVFKSADLIGITREGKFIAVEVKHPGWKAPQNEREQAQWAFLQEVVIKNGIGFFATSVEDFIDRITKC